MRVLYFTVSSLEHARNGGSICSRGVLRRLAEDPGIEPSAIVAGRPEWMEGTRTYLDGLGVPFEFIPFREGNVHHSANTPWAIASYLVTALFQYPWELQALNQPQIQRAVDWGIRHWGVDLLLVDYLASALFISLPRRGLRTALYHHNRETDFYAQLMEHGLSPHGSFTGAVSLRRLARVERRVERAVGKVIAIAPPVLPSNPTRSEPACITPLLDRQRKSWRFKNTRQAFFVGNVHHYPNRLAVEWLTQALAPRLRVHRDDARIVIVGAEQATVPAEWRHPNVLFRGEADLETVADLFRTSDLSLCPIDNSFGFKMKAAEALSFGTPLVASEATLKGLPYLTGMPSLPLDDPDASADLIAGLLGDKEALNRQSERQLSQQAAFAATQRDVWSRTLSEVPPR
jgi:glycosyltransferase involved in cell wall biosynthesis